MRVRLDFVVKSPSDALVDLLALGQGPALRRHKTPRYLGAGLAVDESLAARAGYLNPHLGVQETVALPPQRQGASQP